MKTEIIDRGRGPQLNTTRITVLDIFYWIHRGYGWERVHESMPSLSRAEFDVVMEYIGKHRDELAERDRRVEEIWAKRIAEQHARGPEFAPPDENEPLEQRLQRMREIMEKRKAEKAREGNPG